MRANGEWIVLSAVPPGQAGENIAIFLVDRDSGMSYRRFRRDLGEFAPDEADVLDLLEEDLVLKAAELGPLAWMDWLEENASHFIRVVAREEGAVGDFRAQLDFLYHRHVKPKVLRFRTHLPRYSMAAAAGLWGPSHHEVNEPTDWIEIPRTVRSRLSEHMFLAQVTGHSMEPEIPAGSWCIFEGGPALAGSRQNKRVLVFNWAVPTDERATVKRYQSVKKQEDEERLLQQRIVLHPLNPAYSSWEITDEELEEGSRCRVVGVFIAVLDDNSI